MILLKYWEKYNNDNYYVRRYLFPLEGCIYNSAIIFFGDYSYLDIWDHIKHDGWKDRVHFSNNSLKDNLEIADKILLEKGFTPLSEEQTKKYLLLI
jgi:hypothetical protein